MNIREIFRLLTPYTAASSYTLPELATVAFDAERAFASDGISSLSVPLSGSPPRDLCVKAAPVASWLNTLGSEGMIISGRIDGRLELGYRAEVNTPESAQCAFAVSPLSSYRIKVPERVRGDTLCTIADTQGLADALSYVLKRSGTDATFQWASGVTLAFSGSSIRAYMTDNITMAMATCPAAVKEERTLMITHGAAQRLQALMASVPGEAGFYFSEGQLLVSADCAVFSTVTVVDAAELDNFLDHVEPFSELETFQPGPEFVEAVQRHGQFAGREGAGTTIRVEGGKAVLFTTGDGGRIKDLAPMGDAHPDVTIRTGASVLARMLSDFSRVRLTEEAALAADPETGNCTLLCAWDDEEVA